MPPPTVYDIQKKSGLSIATVSRVLNSSARVSPATHKRVMDAANELGYTPSFAARSLAKQRSDLLGAIFPRMASGFFADVLCGLDSAAKASGLHLITAFSHGNEDEETLADRFVSQRLVAALVLMNFDLSEELIARLTDNKIPVVSLDASSSIVSSIGIDNPSGIHQVIEFVKELGHREIAVLMGPANTFDSDQRLDSCLEFATAAGLYFPEKWQLRGGFSEEGGYEAAQTLLQAGRPLPTAILAFNDLMAIGAIRALRDAGLRVPEDVTVTGFDDIEFARHLNLTTVRVPMFELGEAAGQMAAAHLAGTLKPSRTVVPTSLVIRGTSGPPPSKTSPHPHRS